MKIKARIAALAVVFGGAGYLATPPAAHATMAPAPDPYGGDGVAYCCYSLDHTKTCCFESGCAVSLHGCVKV